MSLVIASVGQAEDGWPQFRGPSGQGLHTSAKVPTEFASDQGIRWRTPIDGKGWSSPVVADGRVWLTSAVAAKPSEEQLAKLADDPHVVSVIAAGESYHLLASNQLEGRLMASPAVVGDDLLFRSEQALMRIGNAVEK